MIQPRLPRQSLYSRSKGVAAALDEAAATRSGPSNRFVEPGSFYNAGDIVNVISKAWDSENDIWWYQIEFNTSNGWMRAYTPANRVDVSSDSTRRKRI